MVIIIKCKDITTVVLSRILALTASKAKITTMILVTPQKIILLISNSNNNNKAITKM